MSNKGYSFEASETDEWRKFLIALGIPEEVINKHVYRVEGSGRSKNATKTGSSSILEGDVSVELEQLLLFPKDVLQECKHHKSHTVEKSISVKKEWVDQALHEAEKNKRLSIVAIKFKGVAPNSVELRKYCWADGKFGNNVHYIIPQKHFQEILKYIFELKVANLKGGVTNLSNFSIPQLLEEISSRVKKEIPLL